MQSIATIVTIKLYVLKFNGLTNRTWVAQILFRIEWRKAITASTMWLYLHNNAHLVANQIYTTVKLHLQQAKEYKFSTDFCIYSVAQMKTPMDSKHLESFEEWKSITLTKVSSVSSNGVNSRRMALLSACDLSCLRQRGECVFCFFLFFYCAQSNWTILTVLLFHCIRYCEHTY